MTEELAAQVERICERARNEMLTLIRSRPTEQTIVPLRDWMSATQLAEYWQLYNDKNEPTTAGIVKWSKRPPDQSPLPHAYMGDLLRSIERKPIYGRVKKRIDDEFRTNSDVLGSRNEQRDTKPLRI